MLSYQSINEEVENRLERVIFNLFEKFIIVFCFLFWGFTIFALIVSIYYDIKND